MSRPPLRNAVKAPHPRPIAQDNPTADQIEYRPPTQSQNGNTRSAATPNSPAAATLALTAAKWFPAPSTPSVAASHSLAAVAFARVSRVVKVFETAITRVSSGSSPARAAAISAPSTLAAKRNSIFGSSGLSASQTSRGPRSEPPMPMWTTARNARPVAPRIAPLRTPSAKASIRPLAVSTSPETGCPAAR